jgi:hypothetical protein
MILLERLVQSGATLAGWSLEAATVLSER